MGLKAYRFSISWPRIMPNGKGEINQQGVEFYHKVIDKLISCNIEPIVTTYHWDMPEALQSEYGGWESREIIEDFAEYNKVLFKEYGDKVKYWVSLNEQNIFIGLGYLQKLHPPKVSDYQRFINANHIAFLANARAVEEFKKLVPNGQIGASFAYGPTYSFSAHPDDVLAMEDANELNNNLWMDVYAWGEYPKIALAILEQKGINIPFEEGDKELLKRGTADFMGVNYYQTSTVCSPDRAPEKNEQSGNAVQTVKSEVKEKPFDKYFMNTDNPYVGMTEWNWTIDPEGLRIALRARIEELFVQLPQLPKFKAPSPDQLASLILFLV